MKENILQILAAILLGLAVPGLIIRLTDKEVQPLNKETVVTQAPGQNAENQHGIWVLTEEGTTQWMLLEEYLIGVILAEMPTSYDHQALCAQATVARTYALKRQTGGRHEKGAVCTDSTCCQAYVEISRYLNGLGFARDVEVARSAVESTKGMVVTYGGELIEATYFHSSGGRTEGAAAVWGVDYPYLQVVDSPGEELLEGYASSVYYTREQLELLLDRQLPGKAAGWIGWSTYTVGGGVEKILLAGIEYSGVKLRGLLKLNSTAFSVEADGDGLWFHTLGKGHRVGMSQNGAQAMAATGYTWQEILAHYYPGTRIDKMTDVG